MIIKRSITETGSTFALQTDHTPAFNTVHIIAAVIGVIGVIAAVVAVIIMFKQKKKKRQLSTTTTLIQPNTERFGQFAHDFDNQIEPQKSSISPPPPPYYP